jgi:hypothetical protein
VKAWEGRGALAKMKVPYILSAVLAALMVVQSVLARVFPGQYRDVSNTPGSDRAMRTSENAPSPSPSKVNSCPLRCALSLLLLDDQLPHVQSSDL